MVVRRCRTARKGWRLLVLFFCSRASRIRNSRPASVPGVANISNRNRSDELLSSGRSFGSPLGPVGITDRLLSDFPNVYGDLSANSGRNALARDKDFATKFLERHGSKLVFGSDCGCLDGHGAGQPQGGALKGKCTARETLRLLKDLTTPDLFRRIVAVNALRFFGSSHKTMLKKYIDTGRCRLKYNSRHGDADLPRLSLLAKTTCEPKLTRQLFLYRLKLELSAARACGARFTGLQRSRDSVENSGFERGVGALRLIANPRRGSLFGTSCPAPVIKCCLS